jgi:uncharacterized protein YycO
MMIRPRRRVSSKKSREFWDAVDKIADTADPGKHRVRILGDPWTDTERDLSSALIQRSSVNKEERMGAIQWEKTVRGYIAKVGNVDLRVWQYTDELTEWRWVAEYTTQSGFIWICSGCTRSKDESMKAAYKAMMDQMVIKCPFCGEHQISSFDKRKLL